VELCHVEQRSGAGATRRPRGRAGNFISTWPPEQLAAMEAMFLAGQSPQAITAMLAARFGRNLSPTTVRVKLHRLGWVTRRKTFHRFKR
jgi:hypothetical protein